MISTKIIKNFTREKSIPVPDIDHIADFGFRTLDDVSGGLYIDDFVVLAGPTGAGTGTFGSNVVLNVALQNVHVLAFMSRTSTEDLVKNILDDMAYRKRGKTFEDLQIDSNAVGLILQQISGLPLHIVEADAGEKINGFPFSKAEGIIRDYVIGHHSAVIYIESLRAMGWGADEILKLQKLFDDLILKVDDNVAFATIAGGEIKSSGEENGRLVNEDALEKVGAKAIVFKSKHGSAPLTVTVNEFVLGTDRLNKFRLRISPTGSTFEEIS